MLKQFFIFLTIVVFTSNAFAIDCQNKDEKLVRINGGFNISIYNKHVYANKLHKCESSFNCDLYDGGEWKTTNKDSDNFNIIGTSICSDSYEYKYDKNQTGPYCWCRIKEMDNYRILSEWTNVKLFQNHVFDEYKQYKSEYIKENERKKIIKLNIQNCMDECPKTCQSNIAKMYNNIRGYYICDTALIKKEDVFCTIDKKLIKAKRLSVFDDIAEIDTGETSIVFERDTTNPTNKVFITEYEHDKLYLKVINNGIYVGRKNYSMEECI